jgi:hypothetical protein
MGTSHQASTDPDLQRYQQPHTTSTTAGGERTAAPCRQARGDAGIGARHLLYGVLCDARDLLGTQLSRRSRRQLALPGFAPGRPKPVRLQL